MDKFRESVVEAARKLATELIKTPATDRGNEHLIKPLSTARLLWNLEEIIENGADWSLTKLNRELGIVMGLVAARKTTQTCVDYDPLSIMKRDMYIDGLRDPSEGVVQW